MPARLSEPAPLPPHRRLVASGWALMVFAVPWLLLGGGSAVVTARFLARAEHGVAEVVSSLHNPGSRGRGTWTTAFTLAAPDGTRLTASWTGERAFAQGQAVHVRYRRAPLVRIQPDDRWSTWGWAWVLSGAGGFNLLVGAATVPFGALLRRRGPGPG